MARVASRVRVVGPLGRYRAGFEEALAAAGYTPLSAANQMRVMAHLSRWLETNGVPPAAIAPDVVRAFLDARREAGYTRWLSPRGLVPLLGHLRRLGAVPAPIVERASGPLDEVVERYRAYLVSERGLVPRSVRYYLLEARPFLAGWVGEDGSRLDRLGAAEISGYVLGECARRSVGAAKILVTVLRSLLRFLFLEGLTGRELWTAVPAVAGWRGGHLPKGIGAAQVSALLSSCDRRGATGRRDRAILLLAVRLGLRAVEVARLGLADIDWRRGEITVRGKGRRDERLPLPVDVGEAIAGYLRQGRPRSAERAVFLGAQAPFAPLTTHGVSRVVQRAASRAGLGTLGAHRLRHTAATEMLRAQTPLLEVGQVLRHRSVGTTAIYAKVDRVALRELAMPWPGVRT